MAFAPQVSGETRPNLVELYKNLQGVEEAQRTRSLDSGDRIWHESKRLVNYLSGEPGMRSKGGEALLALEQRISFHETVDGFIYDLDLTLVRLEGRARILNEGRRTQPDRVLAIGLARFPLCVNPILRLVSHRSNPLLERQKTAAIHLMVRHYRVAESMGAFKRVKPSAARTTHKKRSSQKKRPAPKKRDVSTVRRSAPNTPRRWR